MVYPHTPLTTSLISSSSCPEGSALRLPTEVCETVIDMLYSHRSLPEELEYLRTLRSCALVCRDWRVRAQRMIFYLVHLSTVSSLKRFSAVLHVGQHLGTFVHQVMVVGRHLHTTTSLLSLFYTVLAGRLPNLQGLHIRHIKESDTWYSEESNSPEGKPLPYIPLHPRFPTFLSSFKQLSNLYLEGTVFRSFNEVARMVHLLPSLETLACVSVKWLALGPVPAFMHRGFKSQCPKEYPFSFAPNIRWLGVRGS